MNQICLFCERTSPDRNLYCQEVYCPAEMSPIILDYGEWFGDIEIVRALVVLRSAVVYEAMHQKKRVYMKVAHPGPDNKERLKREAEFLQGVALSKKTVPGMPTLLPAYANTTVKADAYGKTMLQGHLLYFYLFEYAEGDTLREVLVKNPQLWINHVGWIMEDVATVVNFLHRQGVFHYGLSPDSILVHFDEKENLPKVLLLDLGIVSSKSTLSRDWYAFAVPPAYTAPELASSNGAGPRADYRTDVYGLGLTLYEMLVGEPAYTYKLRSDKDVYRSVLESRRVAMNRVEDVEAIARIAVQAVSPYPDSRQAHAAEFTDQLHAFFGNTPRAKKSRMPKSRTLVSIAIVLLVLAFLITLVVTFGQIIS